MKKQIENRLQTSVDMDAINGDFMERAVVGLQIQEAIYEIRKLRSELAQKDAEIAEAREILQTGLDSKEEQDTLRILATVATYSDCWGDKEIAHLQAQLKTSRALEEEREADLVRSCAKANAEKDTLRKELESRIIFGIVQHCDVCDSSWLDGLTASCPMCRIAKKDAEIATLQACIRELENKCTGAGIEIDHLEAEGWDAIAKIKELETELKKLQAFWGDSRLADKMRWLQYDWPKHQAALEVR